MGGVVPEGYDGNLIAFEVLKHFVLEPLEDLPLRNVSLSDPIVAEPVLPAVPIEHLIYRERQLLVFRLGRG